MFSLKARVRSFGGLRGLPGNQKSKCLECGYVQLYIKLKGMKRRTCNNFALTHLLATGVRPKNQLSAEKGNVAYQFERNEVKNNKETFYPYTPADPLC